MNIDFDFKELERKVVKEFEELNRLAGKPVHYMDIVTTSAKVAIVAIQKYHEEYHQTLPKNQQHPDEKPL